MRRSFATSHPLRRSRRGFTLIEVVIGGAVALAVMGSVVSLFYLSALTIHDALPRGLKAGLERRVVDAVRYRLMHGRPGSQAILEGGARIEFNDPNRGNDTVSAFWFEDGSLRFDDDLNDAAEGIVIARGVDEIEFLAGDSAAVVALRIVLTVPLSKGRQERREGRTHVYLRNGGPA